VATVNWLSTLLKTYGDNCIVVTWGPITTTNADGQRFEMPGWADRSVHVFGTFGAGATLSIQGSNEAVPTNWVLLAAAGDATEDMAFLTAGGNDIKQVLEVCRWVRPLLTGGDGTTSLTVAMLVKRPAPA
jgi:hypothetical protein